MRLATSNLKILIGAFVIVILVAIVFFGVSRIPERTVHTFVNPIAELHSFVDAANEASGIQSGAAFNYAPTGYGNPSNFGIERCVNEVRCDNVIKKQVAKFQQPNQPSPDTAEVDTDTGAIVSFHRAIPGFAGGELPQNELEKAVREFLDQVSPEFKNREGALSFEPGMKGTRLNNGNYFFRWVDERYAVPDGLQTEVQPFVQVGITTGGFIYSYDNTIELYRNLSQSDLRTLCAAVQKMPYSDDVGVDLERRMVEVNFMGASNENRYLLLPLDPAGCSESVQAFLKAMPH